MARPSLNRFFVSESFRSLSGGRGLRDRESRLNRFFVSESFRSFRSKPSMSCASLVSIASSSANHSGPGSGDRSNRRPAESQSLLRQRIIQVGHEHTQGGIAPHPSQSLLRRRIIQVPTLSTSSHQRFFASQSLLRQRIIQVVKGAMARLQQTA